MKFCSHCMQEMRQEYHYCSKNCLECPVCGSTAKISVLSSAASSSSNVDSRAQTNKYLIQCPSCEYRYKLPLERRNSRLSVSKLLQNKINESNSELNQFSDLEKYYICTSREEIKFIRKREVSLLRDNYTRSQSTNLIKELEQEIHSDPSTLMFDPNLSHPKFTPLQTKTSKRCKSCREIITKPESDPSSVRFYKLSNAFDHLPVVQLYRNGKTRNLMLLFKSNHEKEISVNISSLDKGLFFPVSKFNIKPKSPIKSLKGYLKGLSLIEIESGSTKTARIETMNRRPLNYGSSNEIIDEGEGFVVIPIKIESVEVYDDDDANDDSGDDSKNKILKSGQSSTQSYFTMFVNINVSDITFGYFLRMYLE